MSKKVFNFEDYKGRYVMCCKTEEEAKDFCRVMHEAGKKWDGGDSYDKLTHWKDCESEGHICYNFNEGLYCPYAWYAKKDYKILFWSDFMNKEFAKADLRNGDVVLRRKGRVEIYINNRLVDNDGSAWFCDLLMNDLTSSSHEDYDIMAVRRPNDISDMSFDAFEKKLGSLVYERKEREETVEMTIEEVCKALGKNVKIVKGDK